MGSAIIGSKRIFLLALVLFLVVAGVVVWAERETLRSWYYLHRLETAEGEAGDLWAERTAGLGSRVVPDLLTMLGQTGLPCTNARKALGRLVADWGRENPRSVELTNEVVSAFPSLSPEGQRAALELAIEWTRPEPPCPESLASAGGRLLPLLARHSDAEVRAVGLDLALQVAKQSKAADGLCPSWELARAGFKAAAPRTRLRAIALALAPGIGLQKDLVPLLYDPCPEVRRAAMTAVGPDEKLIHLDSLIPWLHDPDPEVRQLCEASLRRRKLRSGQIRLCRLITDPRWRVRLSVLEHLDEARGVNRSAWLHRLSHDASPAVRAAAIRAACEDGLADLTDRVRQMSQQDPEESIRALARHYLNDGRTARSYRRP
jgi:hypothetical protein